LLTLIKLNFCGWCYILINLLHMLKWSEIIFKQGEVTLYCGCVVDGCQSADISVLCGFHCYVCQWFRVSSVLLLTVFDCCISPYPGTSISLCVMTVWRSENINRTVSVLLCFCATIMVWAVLTAHSTESGFDLTWFRSLSSKRLYIFGLRCAVCIFKYFCDIHYHLVSWAGGIGPWPGWLTIVLQCYDSVVGSSDL